MNDAERALLADTVGEAVAGVPDGDGAAIDRVLADLGWLDMLDAETDAAIEVVFRALGSTNGHATVLDDVIVQSVVTLVNMAGRKLGLAATEGDEGKDLNQAHTAIEAVRALLPLVPEEPAAPIREALSQLQMAYVRETESGGAQPVERKPTPFSPRRGEGM